MVQAETVTPVIEATGDEEIVAPDRAHTATVTSVRDGHRGKTEVVVSSSRAPTKGIVVFAVPLPEVPLRARWKDAQNLIVGYPRELTSVEALTSFPEGKRAISISRETFEGAGTKVAELQKEYSEALLAARRAELQAPPAAPAKTASRKPEAAPAAKPKSLDEALKAAGGNSELQLKALEDAWDAGLLE